LRQYPLTTGFTLDHADWLEAVHWTATLPPHVNVILLEVRPVAQSFAPCRVERTADR
jgi:hypothetical protein